LGRLFFSKMASLFPPDSCIVLPPDSTEITPEETPKRIKCNITGIYPDVYYELQLCRFRGFEELTLSFPGTGIILLDGRSGIGKTTLLEAISFVLYDGAKNTCYPRVDRNSRKKHASTWVKLTFPNGFIIYRQRRPNLFWIQKDGITLTDDAAQGYVDDMFGLSSNWLAGGYLRQGEFCAFLSMSTSDKLNFLQEISLPTQFESLLERVTGKIIETNGQLQEIVVQVKVYHEMYMNMYNNCPKNVRDAQCWNESTLDHKFTKFGLEIPNSPFQVKLRIFYNELDSKCLTKEIQTLRDEIDQAQIKIIRAEQIQKQRDQLQQQLDDIQKELDSINGDMIDFPTEISRITSEIQELQEQILTAQNFERKSQLLAAKNEIQRRLDDLPDETSSYTLQQLNDYERIQQGPNLEYIEHVLEDIQVAKAYQIALEKYSKRKLIKDRLEAAEKQLAEYPNKSVNDEIDILTRKIYSLSLRQNKLVCPKCSGELYLDNGQLTELPESNISNDSQNLHSLHLEKSKLQEQERRYQQRDHVQNNIESLQKTLALMDEVELPEKPKMEDITIGQLNNNQIDFENKKAERIGLPNVDINIERRKIMNSQERSKLLRDIALIQKELGGIDLGDIPNDQKEFIVKIEERKKYKMAELAKLNNLHTKISTTKARHEQIKGQLDNLIVEEIDKSIIEGLKEKLNLLIQEQENLRRDVTTQLQLMQMLELFGKHKTLTDEQTKISERIGAFQKIRATLITAEYVVLDNILSNLNIIIADVLGILFNEPITVTLRSLRQLKSNDRIKPEINIEICYKGAEFNNLNELSGGEKSRVSLALVIAFARIGKSPFLLLDESLSSLDVITKESAITAIRRYLNNKLIIAVNHDTTEGVYDSVLHLQ